MCLGILRLCGVDLLVALHQWNAADCRLPTCGPHGTKLGHSRFQWIIKVFFLAGLTILKKEICLGIVGGCGGDAAIALRIMECRILPPTYFWAAWHQTRAFLIAVNNKSDFLAGLTIMKKEICLGILGWCGGDPAVALRLMNAADYRLPTFGLHGTKLGHSWLQWIIKVIFWLVWQFWKRRCVW